MSQKAGQQNNTLTEFTPTPYQEEFLRGDKRYLGFVSGVGAGKTYAGIIRTFLNMEKWNPGEMGAIVAPTRQMVVNVIIPEMRDLGLLDKWEYNSSYSDEPGLHSPNGSRALILSADNQKTIERLRGLNLSWGWIDERTAVDSRAKEILSQRLRTGNYRNLFETTTPKGKDDTYEFYTQEADPEQREFGEATIYESDDRLAIVGVPTGANPNTPEDYKADMQNLPEEIRAQEVAGQFVEIGSGIYQREHFTFVDPESIRSKLEQADWTQTIIGVDPAVQADSAKAQAQDSDYWACTVAVAHSRLNKLFVMDTEKRRGMTLSEGVEWLSAIRNQTENAKMIVESNQSQRYLVDALRQNGISVTGEVSTTNKEARLTDLSIPIANGTIQFVDWNHNKAEGHPYQDVVQEALSFPEGSHDDQLDSLAITARNAPIDTVSDIFTADGWGQDDE